MAEERYFRVASLVRYVEVIVITPDAADTDAVIPSA